MKLFEIKSSDKELADEFIKGWTYDPSNHKKTLSNSDKMKIEAALRVYPLKSNKVLYRGLSFSSKGEYEKFFLNLSDLDEKFLSSWTFNKAQAESYAMIDDDYDDAGYGGVVISTKASDLRAIDASKSSRGEKEIICMPTKLKIKIVKKKVNV